MDRNRKQPVIVCIYVGCIRYHARCISVGCVILPFTVVIVYIECGIILYFSPCFAKNMCERNLYTVCGSFLCCAQLLYTFDTWCRGVMLAVDFLKSAWRTCPAVTVGISRTGNQRAGNSHSQK